MASAVPNAVPVFPLPGVVLFPHTRLALHVFEPRYRTLVRDALAGARMLAIATLRPGWDRDYHGSPEFHELGCLARCEQVEWLPDDCYQLEVLGFERVRFGRQQREFPYRCCEVETLRDAPWDADDPLAAMERAALLAEIARIPRTARAWAAPPEIPEDAALDVIVNTLAQGLQLATADRLELLAADSVFDRARRLHEHLERVAAATPPGPPPAAPPGPLPPGAPPAPGPPPDAGRN